MPSMLDAFTLKEYDLEPALTAWTDAPRFNGVASKGLQVDDWLDAVKAGCEARNIPRDYWPKVGQHLLDGRARKRFDELKAVLRQMHGGRYRWDWKRFKVAMRNMGWEIADDETETIKVSAKPSGSWWVLGGSKKVERDSPPAYTADPDSTHLTPGKTLSSSEKKRSTPEQKHQASEKRQPEKKQSADERPDKPKKPSKKNSVTSDTAGDDSADKLLPARPTAQRRMTSWLTRRESTTSAASEHELVEEPIVIECVPAAESSVGYFKGSSPSSTASSPAQTPGEVVTTATAHAPLWLLNASNALDFLSSEHPKTMSTIAAVLITVGSLPALPGLSAVAGGTVLASHAVQAAGAIAVGVGNWLKSAQDNVAARGQQQHDADTQAPSSNQQVVSTKGR